MGEKEKKLPFSIISKGKKIKKLKKLGWKGYLLFISFFIIVGGLVAYYQSGDEINSSKEFSSGTKKHATNKKLTLERISQREQEIGKQEKDYNKFSQAAISSQQSKDTKEEQDKPEQSRPQMSSEKVTATLNNLIMPIQGEIISNCEWYKDEVLDAWKYNPGINIKGEIGAKIKAAQKGTVQKLIKDDYQGLTVIIKHNEIYKTLYSNLENSSVQVGDQIDKGQSIGELGDSGLSANSSKLHFEIIKEDKNVEPMEYFEIN